VATEPRLREVVFAHDYPFLRAQDGAVYSDRGDWPWQHYLDFAERVTVASRSKRLVDAARPGLTPVDRAGVSFEPIPSLSGPRIRFTHRSEARARLRRLLDGADALVARLPSEIGALAVEVAERASKPYAVELVTCTWDALWNYGTWQGKVYAPVSWWQTRRAVRRAPRVLYVTREFLQQRYPTRGVAVACSDVELPALDATVLERRLARVRRASDGAVRIGTIAALTVKFKGVQTALAALGGNKDRLPPFQLHVLGAGDPAPWRELARRHGVEQETRFDGTRPPGSPVHEWLDGLDLYVQPSFQEGLPRSLVEALSRALPALGSTAGGIPELLAPECLHRPGDAARLGELIVAAVGNADWQEAQARRNFEVARGYEQAELDRIRTAFWREFAQAAGG
jgi:glycosyltransferase involved in cell wall biosynthesis